MTEAIEGSAAMPRTIEHQAALARLDEMRRTAAVRRTAGGRVPRGPRRGALVALAALALAVALALPSGAFAAGKVNTTTTGTVTYEGDAGANVVQLTTTPVPGTGKATVVIAEDGIAEGNDTKNICTPSPGTVTCTIDLFKITVAHGHNGDDRLTINGPVGVEAYGDAGADELVGGTGDDFLFGGSENDSVGGREGRDNVDGGAGADVVSGGDGADVNFGDAGDGDRIDMGAGRDVLVASNAAGTGDELTGGDGADTLLFAAVTPGETPSTTVDLARGTVSWPAYPPHAASSATLTGFEDAGELFGEGNDTLIGDAGPNLLAGGAGKDTIIGGAGTDTLYGDHGFTGADELRPFAGSEDTIDAWDGFADRVDCGKNADAFAGDQFDSELHADCEAVDLRTADPFGIAPSPPAPAPTSPSGGGQPQTGGSAQPRDARAPVCLVPSARAQKRRAFLRRGFGFALRCDEQAKVEVSASVTVKRARRGALSVARRGDLVLDTTTVAYTSGAPKVTVTVPRGLRAALGRRFTVRLRIDATDFAGNRTTRFASVKVR